MKGKSPIPLILALIALWVVLGGVWPFPVPGPTPGALGFTKLAYEEGMKLSDKTKAPALADNFDGTAAAIAAGAIKTVEESLNELRTKNQATVDRTLWLPWFEAWQKHADELSAAKKLTTLENYADAYRETATGLRRVR